MKKPEKTSKEVVPVDFKFSLPPEVFKDGEIVKIATPNGLGIGKVTFGRTYLPATVMLRLHKPVEQDGKVFQHIIKLQACDPDTKQVIKSKGVLLVSGTDAEAQDVFKRVVAGINAQQNKAETAIRNLETLPVNQRAVEEAQWKALADLWPETVSALMSGEDTETAYAAERYLLTGRVEKADKAIVDATHKWSRRELKMNLVKQELSIGWISKGYDRMGQELSAAIEKATGILIPIKTIRSVALGLNLTSHSSVRPGPK